MKKYGMLMFGILALVGAFFPVAKSGALAVSVNNIGGISYLLYAAPLAAIALSVVALYKSGAQHIKTLFVVVAGIGIGICVYSIYQGMEVLKYMGSIMQQAGHGRMVGNNVSASAMPAGGGWMMLLGYCAMVAYLRVGIFDTQDKKENTEKIAEDKK
ncbi:MAG TPA: hypothetical protein PK661_02520 [Syntrophorhabdaceae bacterium]|nr:hypothetical protein [Syntrophorhabdaceae bacterium]HOS58948.1 hypothetical protein [Syntrophorhabdaceae bacterium]